VSQGWSGAGTALRAGAISKPLAIPQKKNLAGLGKDRDDAFPFWDHVFSAAAKSIKLRVLTDDESDSEKTDNADTAITLKRTSTGILSSRRPPSGTPVDSGADTGQDTKYSLIVTAKREAARKGLYSRFFRGPVLGTELHGSSDEEHNCAASETVMNITSTVEVTPICVTEREKSEVKKAKKRKKSFNGDNEDREKKHKKRRKDKDKEKKGPSSSKRKIKPEDGSDSRAERRKLPKVEQETQDITQDLLYNQGGGLESVDRLPTDGKKKKRKKHSKRNIELVVAQNDIADGKILTTCSEDDGSATATRVPDGKKKKKAETR